MTTWTPETLQRIADADELHIAPRRADGTLRTPTTIWVVREGDDLYVRSWRGAAGTWWNTARAGRTGHISAGGVETDVTFTPVGDPAVNDRVDGAYRAKYGRYSGYVEPMVAEPARATTLRLSPQP
ncbi:DUF2255 family protein [Streptomyces sparsogenes]|uniref:DUF2255 family protein n=1 Tax=Streptomyces sparsogenes DSM 40356 TaxID=1331668 RepID=A0A1R1SBM3_9ACTN|nr:DUF2255 family protein [Streptomyces sparsogenes]OMI35716.1 hypothetical protein SPAR_29166 [Streptomyces sparsogenes DSM 40356]